jgi:hypothetical protein
MTERKIEPHRFDINGFLGTILMNNSDDNTAISEPDVVVPKFIYSLK